MLFASPTEVGSIVNVLAQDWKEKTFRSTAFVSQASKIVGWPFSRSITLFLIPIVANFPAGGRLLGSPLSSISQLAKLFADRWRYDQRPTIGPISASQDSS
jgi:hypothetical protein